MSGGRKSRPTGELAQFLAQMSACGNTSCVAYRTRLDSVAPLGSGCFGPETHISRERGRPVVITTVENRKSQMRGIVCEILEIDPGEISEDSLFKEDHDADSLGMIEILALLEKTYSVTIDETELIRMVNLSGVYAVVASAAGWESAG